jgi:DNA-binding transcriptional regulator WhiA
MKYTKELIDKVLEDYKIGKNKSQLEKDYGVPRGTIRYWINNEDKIYKDKQENKNVDTIVKEICERKAEYNYILGLYLGDGSITSNKMSYRLRITQDNKYPLSIIDIKNKMNTFFNKEATLINGDGKCCVITIFDKNLPLYFPQHDTGKKHDRPILLSDYQRDNIDYLNLMSGLWMSDGSFYKTARGYEAYNFTNKSTDIIALFEECLNNFGIRYRKRMKKNEVWIVEITKKSEIVKMKEIVGMKS